MTAHGISAGALFLVLALVFIGAAAVSPVMVALGAFIGVPAVIVYFITFKGFAGRSR